MALLTTSGAREAVYASDANAAAIESIAVDLGEGPCIDAVHARSPILIADLADRQDAAVRRWPFFVPRMQDLGVRGIFAFPLQIGHAVLGTFVLHRMTGGALLAGHVSAALTAADAICSALLDSRLEDLTVSSASVHQAAGMVMWQLDTTIDVAMTRLRATAFLEGTSLVALATDVVDGSRRFTREAEQP